MTLARLKTATREVWQFNMDDDAPLMPAWVKRCFEWRVEDDGSYEFLLVRRSGKQRLEEGDYLIRDLDGDPEWLTETDFLREYELS